MDYFTEENVNVTKRINEKRTHLFLGFDSKSRMKANKKAVEIGSYTYDIYSKNKNKKMVHVGFAVPK